MACGGWMTKHLVADLPDPCRRAFDEFHYGPVMVINVGVTNWRFFDRLGIAVARSFGTLGWHVSVRRNVREGTAQPPFTPDSPTILTYYVPLLSPGLDAATQASASRHRLMSLSFRDIERTIRMEMSEMFGPAGFDHKRGIAGIVVNRWGHAYLAPQPGFFFGKNGNPAPGEVLSRPHGRIIFAHSELQGNMNMAHAMLEGRRGGQQAIEVVGN